jgi:hypothetical protein
MPLKSSLIRKSRQKAALARHKLLQILPGERIDANIIENVLKVPENREF